MNALLSQAMEIDIGVLVLRYAHTRVRNPKAMERLIRSIDCFGQLRPVTAVLEDDHLVLIDGYLRVQVLERLNQEKIKVQLHEAGERKALLSILSPGQDRPWEAIEHGFVIRELVNKFSSSLHEIARGSGRDVSWVQRRMALVASLPDEILGAVSAGRLSSWAATRVLSPLARANSDHARKLTSHLLDQPMSTRELVSFHRHYQESNRLTRSRMIEQPSLFLKTLAAKSGQDLEQGPEGAWVKNLGMVMGATRKLLRLLPTAIYAGQADDDRKRLLTSFHQAKSLFKQLEEKIEKAVVS
ncbi:MAG: ParB/RepB/Spo0J family partition protein [Deltaproteobacteria bacterium]|nr:ParB/RepB/Spo0J family partition protein [Deltaproteobacteria bacterium]